MKVLFEHLDQGLGTTGPHNAQLTKHFWVSVLLAMFLSGQMFCKKWGKNFCRWLLHCY